MGRTKKPTKVMPPDCMTGGVVRLVIEAEGYAMVRRPRCTPFVVSAEQWNSWPDATTQRTD